MGWRAQLSNGELVVEPDTPIRDELSPWHLLIERCRQQNLQILHLSLKRGGTVVSCIPLQTRGVTGYTALYQVRRSANRRAPEILQGIGTVMGDLVFINWVTADGAVFQEVQQLQSHYIHSTQRERGDIV